ncbi:MAG: hypothetical protein R3C03_03440 [Pirellulaceae bacterium]
MEPAEERKTASNVVALPRDENALARLKPPVFHLESLLDRLLPPRFNTAGLPMSKPALVDAPQSAVGAIEEDHQRYVTIDGERVLVPEVSRRIRLGVRLAFNLALMAACVAVLYVVFRATMSAEQ